MIKTLIGMEAWRSIVGLRVNNIGLSLRTDNVGRRISGLFSQISTFIRRHKSLHLGLRPTSQDRRQNKLSGSLEFGDSVGTEFAVSGFYNVSLKL